MNQLTFKLKPEHMETFVGKSQTVPDETLTMREIITRFSRTGQVDSRLDRRGVYTDNPSYDSPDMEELSKMDIYERQEVAAEMKQANQEKIDRINKAINDKKDSDEKKKSDNSPKDQTKSDQSGGMGPGRDPETSVKERPKSAPGSKSKTSD